MGVYTIQPDVVKSEPCGIWLCITEKLLLQEKLVECSRVESCTSAQAKLRCHWLPCHWFQWEESAALSPFPNMRSIDSWISLPCSNPSEQVQLSLGASRVPSVGPNPTCRVHLVFCLTEKRRIWPSVLFLVQLLWTLTETEGLFLHVSDVNENSAGLRARLTLHLCWRNLRFTPYLLWLWLQWTKPAIIRVDTYNT